MKGVGHWLGYSTKPNVTAFSKEKLQSIKIDFQRVNEHDNHKIHNHTLHR